MPKNVNGAPQNVSSSAPSEQADSGGVSDPGGGGDLRLSTNQEVIAAIKRAKAFLLSEKGKRFLRIHLPTRLGEDKAPDHAKVKAVLEKIADIDSYLPKSQVTFLESDTLDANCAAPGYKEYPDAYVSSFSVGANICFNIQRLRRLPADILYFKMIAIWAHEMTHLNGYEEPMADVITDLVLQSSIQLNASNAASTLRALSSSLLGTYGQFSIALKGPGDINQRATLTAALGQLLALENFKDFIEGLDAAYALDDNVPALEKPSKDLIRHLFRASGYAQVGTTHFQMWAFAKDNIIKGDNSLGCALVSVYELLDLLKIERPDVVSPGLKSDAERISCPESSKN